MCYVDNVVDACIRSASSDVALGATCFNVACGERTTNNDILEYLKLKYPGSISHSAPPRIGDVKHTQACIEKISKTLGYSPLVMTWEGIDKTIEWIDTNWENICNIKNI